MAFKSGQQVKFTARGGHEWEILYAKKIIPFGAILTVLREEEHPWMTDVWFVEYPDEVFNSVMFDPVE